MYKRQVLSLPDRKTELLFVTLDKREGYHERIAYHDYAISSEIFHWQSQNNARPATTAGRRYMESPSNGWTFQLFVRLNRNSPYRACGPVTRERAEGEKPMTLYWNCLLYTSVVAATGTGKTVVAAFDYRSLCFIDGGLPRLLFVAHREEILRQSMRTYREVLRDNTCLLYTSRCV